jgi:hypothetical protein
MTEHVLDQNTAESSYFARLSKNGKAAYRHAVYTLTGDLPIWAKGLRTVYTKKDAKVYTDRVYTLETKVVTSEVVTEPSEVAQTETKTAYPLSYEEERNQPGWIDPLTLLG